MTAISEFPLRPHKLPLSRVTRTSAALRRPRRLLWGLLVAALGWSAPALAQTDLINGGERRGAIEGPAEADTWTFQADVGDYVLVVASERFSGDTDSAFAPRLEIRDPDGVLVGSEFADISATLAAVAEKSGVYTATVRDHAESATAEYTMRLARVPGDYVVPEGDEGGELLNGGNHDGALGEHGDVDMWSFEAEQNDFFAVSVVEVVDGEQDPEFIPYIEILGPDGYPVGATYSGLSARVSATAAITGQYTVLVRDRYGAAVGDYAIRLAKVPGAFIVPEGDEGGRLTNGASQVGFMNAAADVDLWSFEAQANEQIILTVSQTGGGDSQFDFAPGLAVRSPDGTEFGSESGPEGASVAGLAPISGTYTAFVLDSLGFNEGEYLLTFLRLPARIQASNSIYLEPVASHAIDVSVADPRGQLEQATYTIESPPEGLTLNVTGPTTAELNWTPTEEQAHGTYSVVVHAITEYEGVEYQSSKTITLNVREYKEVQDIVSSQFREDGTIEHRFQGLSGVTYELQRSTDLANWEVVDTFSGERVVEVDTPLAGEDPRVFYRARAIPQE